MQMRGDNLGACCAQQNVPSTSSVFPISGRQARDLSVELVAPYALSTIIF